MKRPGAAMREKNAVEFDPARRGFVGAAIALAFAPEIARAQSCRVTPRDALGPFYKPAAPAHTELCASGAAGAHKLVVTGRVLGMPQCTPLSDALVEVWQADERGDYSQVGAKQDDPRCLLRASIRTDTEGHYRYTTVLPGEYPGRPRHIHYRVSRAGYATLVTQLYFDRRRGIPDALVATPKAEASGVAQVAFDVTLAAA